MLIKWRKNEFRIFLPGTILKIKKGVNAVGEFRYDIYVKFRINRITDLEIVREGTKTLHRHTHMYIHTQRQTDTHTHTEARFISLVFLRKCRNKAKNRM